MYEVDMEATGNLIARLRKEKGLTQGALAKEIDASVQAVSKWERGNGFPETYYQHRLCDIFDITLEELHNGKINDAKRKKTKFYKKYQKTITIIIFIIMPILIFLIGYFCCTYNSLNYYSIANDANNDFHINGILIEDTKYYTLYFGNIDIFNYEISNDDIVTIKLYSDNKEIYYSTDINQSIIKLAKKELNICKLKVKIIINSIKHDEYEFDTKMNVKKVAEDSVESNYENNNTISEEQIITNLLNNGFVKQENNSWIKETINEKLTYYSKTQRMTIAKNSFNQDILIILNYPLKRIDASIYNTKKGVQYLFEKYEYNIKNNKIRCDVGACTSADDILKIYREYENLLFVESNSTKK